jgi:hypothetical protein
MRLHADDVGGQALGPRPGDDLVSLEPLRGTLPKSLGKQERELGDSPRQLSLTHRSDRPSKIATPHGLPTLRLIPPDFHRLDEGESERQEPTRGARRAKTAQFLAMRARIALACAEGVSTKQDGLALGTAAPYP